MFLQDSDFPYKYAPILSISPAEMSAIEELPGKDKDLILPIFSLRGWVGSQKLENTLKRIEKSIGSRYWIANIDEAYLSENKEFLLTGKYPREVFYQVLELLEPQNGFEKWVQFISEQSTAIPTLLWGKVKELESQIINLASLNRGLVIIISAQTRQSEIQEALRVISSNSLNDIFVLLDLGQVASDIVSQENAVANELNVLNTAVPEALLSYSASSFPSSFSGYNRGENPIYERQLFNKICESRSHLRLIYSDRGSARAQKISGGGGIPSPRIDYPLKNDWRYIRREFQDAKNPYEGEKEALYTEIASQMILENYWQPELKLWGTQLIELTSKRDSFGINSPIKATAARINIHLHLQLHYDDIAPVDTDDEWVD